MCGRVRVFLGRYVFNDDVKFDRKRFGRIKMEIELRWLELERFGYE